MPIESDRIAVIGGGFYGCYITKYLCDQGYTNVTLYEQNDKLIGGVSGNCTQRIHCGPHYPRSKATRQHCQDDMQKFCKEFKGIYTDVNSFYTIGTRDAANQPSLVTPEQFENVCYEREECQTFDLSSMDKKFGIKLSQKQGSYASNKVHCINEPFMYIGEASKYFHSIFEKYQQSGKNIQIKLKSKVISIEKTRKTTTVTSVTQTNNNNDQTLMQQESFEYDWIINCSYYCNFKSSTVESDQLKMKNGNKLDVKYEPTIMLFYKPKNKEAHKIKNIWAFMIMDGGFPALSPMITKNDDGTTSVVYCLMSAHLSKLGKFDHFKQASTYLKTWESDFENLFNMRQMAEKDCAKYFRDFEKDFEYVSHRSIMRTKLITNEEFRGSLVWKDEKNENIIQIFSGKMTNCINAAHKVFSLMQPQIDQNIHSINKATQQLSLNKQSKHKHHINNIQIDQISIDQIQM